MIRSFQYKLYPNGSQQKVLCRWLSTCCWLYNQSLEQRIKAYRRRKESVSLYTQAAWLTRLRGRTELLRSCPCEFERDALRRVDRGFKAFFRRVKSGHRPGFPRFRSWRRYSSIECLSTGKYLTGDYIRVPNLGVIRCRGRLLPMGTQKGLRIIRRPTGWYAQIVIDDGREVPDKLAVDAGPLALT